jgi:hypothetical protein
MTDDLNIQLSRSVLTPSIFYCSENSIPFRKPDLSLKCAELPTELRLLARTLLGLHRQETLDDGQS